MAEAVLQSSLAARTVLVPAQGDDELSELREAERKLTATVIRLNTEVEQANADLVRSRESYTRLEQRSKARITELEEELREALNGRTSIS